MTDTPTQVFPTRWGELFDYQGNLAQFLANYVSSNGPVRQITIQVADRLKAKDYDWLLGNVPSSPSGGNGSGTVRLHGFGSQETYVDTTDWVFTKLDVPIPQPKDGRTYTWRWSVWRMEWQKDPFDRCSLCNKVHSPDLDHCSACGNCTTNPEAHLRKCEVPSYA